MLTSGCNHDVWLKLVENQENCLLWDQEDVSSTDLCLTAAHVMLEGIVTTTDLKTSSFTQF